MHLTFLPIAIFGIFGVGYYVGLTIGTVLVMVGVMICFEMIRRASFSRVFFGIKGGHEETMNLYPYTQVKGRDRRMMLALFFHGLVGGMILVLIAMLIAAGILGG